LSLERSASEHTIRSAFDAGRLEGATKATLEAYGAEIASFLSLRLRRSSDTQEVYSMFAEDLWSSLPKFAWRCSMRTWSYTLARNAAARYLAAQSRYAGRITSVSCLDRLPQEPEHPSTPIAYLRTSVKDHFKRLREELEFEDQTLLVLRVDRGMSWRDLAITMLGDSGADDPTVDRESARLRKAFERVKVELRRLAVRDGLIAESEPEHV
jgi:RNA polymerase sigma-70 factor (ECF subfamily)